jgi:predicted nucleic-acid-binding protein
MTMLVDTIATVMQAMQVKIAQNNAQLHLIARVYIPIVVYLIANVFVLTVDMTQPLKHAFLSDRELYRIFYKKF